MTSSKNSVHELNELSIKRLLLLEQYAKLMDALETSLNECRFQLSKTKQAMGFSLVAASIVDMREMEPSFRVTVSNDGFIVSDESPDQPTDATKEKETRLRSRAEKTPKGDGKDEDEPKEKDPKPAKHPFRPFGLLEPQSAKLARQQILKRSLPMVLELASLQMQVAKIEEELKI